MSSICGSDMHPYAGRGVVLDNGITFGHEYTGVIVAVGDEVRSRLISNLASVFHSRHDTDVAWLVPDVTDMRVQDLSKNPIYAGCLVVMSMEPVCCCHQLHVSSTHLAWSKVTLHHCFCNVYSTEINSNCQGHL